MRLSITSKRLRTRVLRLWPALTMSTAMYAVSVAVADVLPPAPAAAASDAPVPAQNVFSSIKQSFNQNFDRDVIRGHFEVTVASTVHRYYCLVDSSSGKREPNGVPGDPVRRADGMLGIKASAVSVYSCASAEQQGLLFTADYPLQDRLQRASSAPAAAVPNAALVPTTAPLPVVSAVPPPIAPTVRSSTILSGMPTVDVAGVRLGMSLDAARALLRSKNLANYYEAEAATATGAAAPRFVNVIAAWTQAADRDNPGESYQIMLTPIPGQERVLAIVHTMTYSIDNAVLEGELRAALVAKYGGYTTALSVPRAPTWLMQRDGSVRVGDGCNRRGLMAGWNEPSSVNTRPNLALDTNREELEFQRVHCGVAIVTEDHPTAMGDTASGGVVTKYTVTAYGPALAADASRQLRDASAKTPKSNFGRGSAPVPIL